MNREAQDSMGQELVKLSVALDDGGAGCYKLWISAQYHHLLMAIRHSPALPLLLLFLCVTLYNTVKYFESSVFGIPALFPFSRLLFSIVSSSGRPKNGLNQSGMLRAHAGRPS